MKFNSKHRLIVSELIQLAEEGQPYSATIVLNKGKYYLHLHIPLELYAKYTTKVKIKSNARLIAGFDINPDRICMVIVDQDGKLRDVRNKHFHEVVLHGYPKEKARDTRLKRLSELIDYACNHNVRFFVLEKIENMLRGKSKSKSDKSQIKLLKT